MPTFILSLNWTEQGIRSVKDAPKRAEASKELAKKVGVEIKQVYLTTGEDDLLVIVDAPNGDNVTKFALALGAQGNVRTRTSRAWPQRRSGACRSMQQQDRAIRAGGAPVRGKSERRADGAAIDWRTAGLSTDACLDQTRRAAGEGDICGHLGTCQAARCARKSRGVHAGARRRQADVQSAMID